LGSGFLRHVGARPFAGKNLGYWREKNRDFGLKIAPTACFVDGRLIEKTFICGIGLAWIPSKQPQAQSFESQSPQTH
jgi:hypothetical protein